MSVSAKVTSKGQVTVPSAVRKELGIHTGDEILFVKEGHRVFIERIPSRVDPDNVYAALARPNKESVDLEESRRRARAGRVARDRRLRNESQ